MRLPDRVKNFIDPYPTRMRPHHVRNGVIVLALITLVTYSAITANIPVINGPPGKPVRAEFATANQVDNRTPVRIHGVDVGKVQKVEGGADPRRSSIVTLRVTKGGVTIHRDARAVIRWRTLMGGRVYVDLDPGSPSAPPLGTGTIGLQRTSSQVEMDDAFRPYAGGTAEAQRVVFKGLTQGFSDARGIDRTIDTLPALRTVERGMEPYRGRDGDDLRRLVASTAKSSAELGRDTSQLQGLVEGANHTLAAFDNRRQDLDTGTGTHAKTDPLWGQPLQAENVGTRTWKATSDHRRLLTRIQCHQTAAPLQRRR